MDADDELRQRKFQQLMEEADAVEADRPRVARALRMRAQKLYGPRAEEKEKEPEVVRVEEAVKEEAATAPAVQPAVVVDIRVIIKDTMGRIMDEMAAFEKECEMRFAEMDRNPESAESVFGGLVESLGKSMFPLYNCFSDAVLEANKAMSKKNKSVQKIVEYLPKTLLALAAVCEDHRKVWIDVVTRTRLPLVVFRLASEFPTEKLCRNEFVLKCVALMCEAYGFIVENGLRKGSKWPFSNAEMGGNLCHWAVVQLEEEGCTAEDESIINLSMLQLCAVHYALRPCIDAEELPQAVPNALRGMMRSGQTIGLATTLAMTLNRGSAATLFHGSALPCLSLVADLIEEPCAFYDTDMYVLLDITLRELTDMVYSADNLVSFLELLLEIVQTKWYQERNKGRVEEIRAVCANAEIELGSMSISFLLSHIAQAIQ